MNRVIGLDFGTTNSAIAVASEDREAQLATFGNSNSFRSILYFPARDRNSSVKLETQAGPDAISSYLEADTKGRLILSIKYLASEPEKIAALIQIITDNLGYALYRAVEQTKVELTEREVADFVFSDVSVLSSSDRRVTGCSDSGYLQDTLERWRFESWLQPDIQSIARCVKSLLDQHAVNSADIGSVFLTGGSSFVPYVRRFFSRTFGADKLRGGEELTTVAKGLALRALE